MAELSASAHRRAALVFAVVTVVGAATGGFADPARAQAAEVSGDAYGYYTSVSLFGGPAGVNGPTPMVTLPATGAAAPVTGTQPSGSAVYGPAHIFGGKWPSDVEVAPPSGPLAVSTKGKPGPGGFVTSTSDITLFPTPMKVTCAGAPPGSLGCSAPGGFGPVVPNEGDELHSTCTANESGATGSTRIVNGMLSTSTDEGGEPKDREPIPENPPVNYTRTGTITNVGDNWRVVYNEQIVDPDGSITVNAIHMFLLGQIAVGEQIVGHVRCSMSAASTSPTTALAASKPPTTAPSGGQQTAAVKPKDSTDVLPFVLVGAGALLAIAVAVVVVRRRRPDQGEPLPE